jgi:hypothetical protein
MMQFKGLIFFYIFKQGNSNTGSSVVAATNRLIFLDFVVGFCAEVDRKFQVG